jgi:polar amino acid transport system substrate-binding protein
MKGFVFLLCFLYPVAHANEINIVTEVFPDFQYLDTNNQLAGRSVEKVKNALNAAGINYTMSANNWSVSYNAALRDKNTCIFSIVRLPPRENKFVWIAELEEFESAIFGLKSRGIKLKTLHDAKRYKIAVLRDNFSHHYLLERGFNESRHLLLIDNLDKIDKLISARRDILDFVVLSKKQFNYRLKTSPKLNLLEPVLDLNTAQSPLYFACNINMDESLITQLQLAFRQTSSLN